MSAIQNFVFEEHLVRVIERDGEPWFVGKDVCGVLGIAKHHQALDTLDQDERGTCIVGTPMGEQQMIVVSEPGVYRLVFRSRKPEAERFKRWLAHEVLPQIRKTGRYIPERPAAPEPFEIDIQHAPLASKVSYLKMISRMRGREAAVAMMPHIGLPDIDVVLAGMRLAPDGDQCLTFILDWRDDDGKTVRQMLGEALASGDAIHRRLRQLGIRAVTEGEPGLLIATSTRCTAELFANSRWANGAYVAALRGLAGVTGFPRSFKFDGAVSRALFVPASLL